MVYQSPQLSKQKIDLLIADMEMQRNPREAIWREIDRHLVPGMCRFELTDQDQDTFRNDHILDSTADQAFMTCENGMIANVTNPSQPWLKLKPAGDPDLAEYGPAAAWYDDVARILLGIIEDSGTYEAFQDLYGYAIKFSNGLFWMEEDYEKVVNANVVPMGQWYITKDGRGNVNSIYRRLRMTVRSVVETFGRMKPSGSYDWSNFSNQVKDAWDTGRYQQYVDVGHLVMPNPEYRPLYRTSTEKRFKSCYFELGGTPSVYGSTASAMKDEGRYLRESGYDQIPAFVFQWHTTGHDIYGLRCPGITSLPDNRELQHWKLKKTVALDKMVDPPTYGPPWSKFLRIGHLPGQHTAVQDTDLQRGGIRKLYEQDPRILEVMDHLQEMKSNINKAFFVDVFQMLDSLEPRQRTATEINARHNERLSRLVGPHNKLVKNVFSPFVDRLFTYAYNQGRLPEPPDEVREDGIKVEYVSTMAQAMRALNMSGLDVVLDAAIRISQIDPAATVLEKIDAHQFIDEYAKSAGTPARVIRGDEQVIEIQKAKAEAQAQQQRMMQMEAMAKGVKDLANSPTDGENVLTDLVKGMSGNAA